MITKNINILCLIIMTFFFQSCSAVLKPPEMNKYFKKQLSTNSGFTKKIINTYDVPEDIRIAYGNKTISIPLKSSEIPYILIILVPKNDKIDKN